jgi:sec-independent protein translocase protein TatA
MARRWKRGYHRMHMTGWTSPTHIVLLLLIALLLFGAKRLPEIGRALGTGMREFKDSVTGHGPSERPELPPAETTTTSASAAERERESV